MVIVMKRLRYTALTLVMVVVAMFSSCKDDKVPPDVLGEDRMAKFLKEAYLLEGFYAVETEFQYDTLHPEMIASYDSLLREQGLTREDFERSVEWHTHHPEVYQRVHDTVVAWFDRDLADFATQ